MAGVISHEIGHVVARHAAERMDIMEKENNKTWLYAGGGGTGAAAGLGLGLLICGKDDTACLVKAAALGGVVGWAAVYWLRITNFCNLVKTKWKQTGIGFKLCRQCRIR